MYIPPNTEVILLANVPLDKSYLHTVYYTNRSAQSSYFKSKAIKSFTALSYQRMEKGRVRIEADIGQVFHANYLMYQNKAFENRWIYAFVTSVQYVSNHVVDVTFEVDVLQTWFMVDCTVGDCFVEREHVVNDYPGWNVIPENLEQGPYISNGGGMVFRPQADRNRVIVQATFDRDMNDGEGGIYDYTYTGLNFLVFNSAEEVNAFIEKATQEGKTDGIIAMYMLPDIFPSDFEASSVPLITSVEIPKSLTSLGGYEPRNKKLLAYPYNKLSILTDADSQDYRYELFNDQGATKWTVRWVCNPEPAVILQPDNYAIEGLTPQPQYRMTLSGFPQCPYITDIYKVYMGQNSSSEFVKILSTTLGALAKPATGALTGGAIGAVGGVMSAASEIGGMLAQYNDLERKPPQMNGAQSSTADYAARAKNFYYNHQCITRHYAAVLDSYFDMYGYRVCRVKTPNMNTRPHWNYVKCPYVSIKGSVPADALTVIENVFKSGITFWKNPSEIGNYQLDNQANS